MSSIYDPLRKFLENKPDGVTLTFGEIESILGFELPKSARNHKAWWGIHSSHTQSVAWGSLRLIAKVDLKNNKVNFVKEVKK